MIDFEIPAEAQEVRERVRAFVQQECIPAEKELERRPYKEVLGDLRTQARAQGMWCPFIPKEHGGMGLGPLANALVQMELGFGDRAEIEAAVDALCGEGVVEKFGELEVEADREDEGQG